MRISNAIIIALPALSFVAADDQKPLGDKLRAWFDKATSLIPTTVPSVLPNPLDAGAAKVASVAVTDLTLANWQETIRPSVPSTKGGPEEWLVYINGGNKTCYGLCGNTTKAWNTAAALLTTGTSNPPHLATINCEKEGVLCAQWAITPPAIYHIALPRGAADAKPTVRYIPLNQTSTTPTDITNIVVKKTYTATKPYEGVFQPWTGFLATTGLGLPLAHALYYFSLLPSWAPMILISLASRTFINKRMPRGQPAPATAPAPAPAQ